MRRLEMTIFANLGGLHRCGGQAFFDKCLSFQRGGDMVSSCLPPMGMKNGGFENQNRRWA